jgi:hypothetical protein
MAMLVIVAVMRMTVLVMLPMMMGDDDADPHAVAGDPNR